MTVLDPCHIVRRYLLQDDELTDVIADRIFVGRLEPHPDTSLLIDNVPCIWFTQEGGPMYEQVPVQWALMCFRCVGRTLVQAQTMVERLRQMLQYPIRGGMALGSPGLLQAIHDQGPRAIPSYDEQPDLREMEGLIVYYRCLVELGRAA